MVNIALEDVNGSFARFIREAPKEVRRRSSAAVFDTGHAVQQRMQGLAPVGPDGEGLEPGDHIRNAIEVRGRHGGLHVQVGIFDDPGQVSVALFNEYQPNRQPFMRPAAADESGGFKDRAIRSLQQAAAALSSGV